MFLFPFCDLGPDESDLKLTVLFHMAAPMCSIVDCTKNSQIIWSLLPYAKIIGHNRFNHNASLKEENQELV